MAELGNLNRSTEGSYGPGRRQRSGDCRQTTAEKTYYHLGFHTSSVGRMARFQRHRFEIPGWIMAGSALFPVLIFSVCFNMSELYARPVPREWGKLNVLSDTV